jgi:hypothetical protein
MSYTIEGITSTSSDFLRHKCHHTIVFEPLFRDSRFVAWRFVLWEDVTIGIVHRSIVEIRASNISMYFWLLTDPLMKIKGVAPRELIAR